VKESPAVNFGDGSDAVCNPFQPMGLRAFTQGPLLERDLPLRGYGRTQNRNDPPPDLNPEPARSDPRAPSWMPSGRTHWADSRDLGTAPANPE